MSDLVGLSEDDLRVVRSIVERVRRLPLYDPPGSALDDPYQTPDVLTVKVPIGGIPAMSGLTPSSASCKVYKKVGGVLVDAGYAIMVCNTSTTALVAGTFPLVWRDKFGTWTQYETAGGGGGAPLLVETFANAGGSPNLVPTNSYVRCLVDSSAGTVEVWLPANASYGDRVVVAVEATSGSELGGLVFIRTDPTGGLVQFRNGLDFYLLNPISNNTYVNNTIVLPFYNMGGAQPWTVEGFTGPLGALTTQKPSPATTLLALPSDNTLTIADLHMPIYEGIAGSTLVGSNIAEQIYRTEDLAISAIQTTTSSTFADLGFSFKVRPNEIWTVHGELYCSGSVGGLKFQWVGTGITTGMFVTEGDTTAVGTKSSDRVTGFLTPSSAYIQSGVTGKITIDGYINNVIGSAGVVKVQFASATNTQSNSVLVGSWFKAHRVKMPG